MNNFDKRNFDVIYSIVSKFPEIINYRKKIEMSDTVDKFLMIVGGTITERDACIDYLTLPPFGKLVGLPSLDEQKVQAMKEVVDFKNKPFHIEWFIKKIADLKTNNVVAKLVLLKELSYSSYFVLSGLMNLKKASMDNSIFVIATAGSLNSIARLPLAMIDMFKKFDITNYDVDLSKKDYPSKEDIDLILIDYMWKYPKQSREFIVRRAIHSIQSEFPDRKLYGKNTLMSRISNIRKNGAAQESQYV